MSRRPIDNAKIVLALLLPLITCLIRWVGSDMFSPFVWAFFYPTVYFSSRLGGKWAGIFSTLLSALLVTYCFIPPELSFLDKPLNSFFSVIVFLVMGTIFSYGHDRLKRAQENEAKARESVREADERLREIRIALLEREKVLDKERLLESEAQFRIMFMESSVGKAQADPVTKRLTKVNAAFCKFLGYDEEELLQLTIDQITHPADREAGRENLQALLTGDGQGYQIEKRYLRRDGNTVYGHATVNLVHDSAGRPTCILAVIQDVTDRRRSEEALRQSEEKFSLAFAGNPAGIALTRLEDGVVLEVNDSWQEMTGYLRDEIVGKSARMMWPDNEALERFIGELKKNGTLRGWEQSFLGRSGRPFVTQLSSQLLMVGGEQIVLSTLVDITSLKQAEKGLKESEARFRSIFDHAPVAIGIGTIDDGRMLEANGSWLRLFGFDREEVIGRTTVELNLYLNDDERNEVIGIVREQGRVINHAVKLRQKSGEIFDVLYSAEVIVLDGCPCLQVMMTDTTEQKLAEQALYQSQHDYRQLFDNMLEGFASCRMIYDGSGQAQDFVYLKVNRAFSQLTGLIDVEGKRVSEVIPGIHESNREMFEVYDRVAKSGNSEHVETYISSLEQWFAVSVYSVTRGCFIAVFDNITNRKRSEVAQNATVELLRICNEAQDLRELMSRSASFFQGLTQCEAVGVRLREGEDFPYYETRGFPDDFIQLENSLCAHDQQGELSRDDAGHPVLDCMCGNIICGRYDVSKPFFTEHGSFWSSCTSELLANTTDADRQAKTRNRCNGEGYESVALIPLRSHEEKIGLFQFNDRRRGCFTAEKIALYENLVKYLAIAFSKLKTDQALKEASQFNQQIIASAQEGIMVYGPDLRYQVWNPYLERLSGIAASEVLGRHPLELFPFLEKAGVYDALGKALAGEETSTIELPFSFPQSKRSGWVSDVQAPLRNTQGDIIGVIGTVRDITSERHLEEQLRQAQKMEAIGQLAGGVAHDFNNILQVMMGYCALLQNDTKLDDRHKIEVEQILMSAERAAQLTQGLLAFSRKQVMKPKRANLCDIVLDVQKFLVRIIGEDITLKVLPSEIRLLPVLADVGQIEQVLINLATNARDAMTKGGTLTLKTELVQIDAALDNSFGHAEAGRYACVTMSDTGAGMDQATRSKIFEPFFTTKDVGKGTGLGMAIVYGIVKQHGGFVNVYSEPGLGTTFRVYLPVIEMGSPQVETRPVLPPPQGGSETILLAEDDAGVRNLMVTVLNKFGYTVLEACDGQEAVDLFAKNRDRISLIIMDMIMPKKNGRDACEEIWRLKPGVRVLFSSGYTSDFMKNRGVSEEGIQLIMKPVQPVELLRRIREMLA